MADQTRKYQANATVFREGESGDWACLVRTGQFELFKGAGEDRKTIAVTGPGTIFGELALIDKGHRMASARCVEAGELILIDRARFLTKIAALSPGQRGVYNELLAFVRETPVWAPPTYGEPAPAMTDKAKRVQAVLPQIETAKLLETGDNFLDVLTKTLVHYAKRRLPSAA
ncbi:MAG: cyclic nucleotide-binding domain-containing protein [Tagaea sp.]